MKSVLKLLIITISYVSSASLSHANVGEIFGLGSRASSMGNAFTAVPGGAFGFYYNPASILFSEKVTAGFGTIYGEINFKTLPSDLILETKNSGDKVRKGDVDINTESTKGSVFGLILPLRKEYPRVAIGGTGYLPFDRLVSIQFEQPYIPIYPIYSKRTQRFSFYGGGATEILPGLSIGAGINLFTRLEGNVVMRATTAEPILVLGINGTPGISPVAGIQYEKENYGIGLSYKYETKSTAKVTLKPQLTNIMGADFGLEWLTAGSYLYDPTQISLGLFSKILDSITVATDLLYQRWSKFQLPYLDIESKGPDLGKSEVRGSFRDTMSPRIGIEYSFNQISFRGGYQYLPSPIEINQSSNLNLLDADKNIYSVGLGYNFNSIFGIEINPIDLDVHYQLHKLKDKEIIKSSDLVGAPGYKVGGSLYNLGLSLTSYF